MRNVYCRSLKYMHDLHGWMSIMEEVRLIDFGILNTKDFNDRSFTALSQKLRELEKVRIIKYP
jgi:hypothetical protein